MRNLHTVPLRRMIPIRSFVLAMSSSAVVPPLPSGELDAAVDRRGTHSRKMQGRGGAFLGKDIVPMWVADSTRRDVFDTQEHARAWPRHARHTNLRTCI